MSEIEEINDMMSNVLAQLQICREHIYKEFDKSGYDLAYFDTDISLKVQVGHVKVEVCEEWKQLE